MSKDKLQNLLLKDKAGLDWIKGEADSANDWSIQYSQIRGMDPNPLLKTERYLTHLTNQQKIEYYINFLINDSPPADTSELYDNFKLKQTREREEATKEVEDSLNMLMSLRFNDSDTAKAKDTDEIWENDTLDSETRRIFNDLFESDVLKLNGGLLNIIGKQHSENDFIINCNWCDLSIEYMNKQITQELEDHPSSELSKYWSEIQNSITALQGALRDSDFKKYDYESINSNMKTLEENLKKIKDKSEKGSTASLMEANINAKDILDSLLFKNWEKQSNHTFSKGIGVKNDYIESFTTHSSMVILFKDNLPSIYKQKQSKQKITEGIIPW